MKIITVCGSLKFKDEILRVALELELKKNIVLTPIMPLGDDKDDYTEKEASILGEMHKEKIKMSDAIMVVNVDNYIGESTRSEIELAESLGIEIMYYTDWKEK